eukprot:jgi/Mesen1/5387/ME000268S04578
MEALFACALCTLISTQFVSSLYVVKAVFEQQGSRSLWANRDCPSVIKQRFVAVTGACLVASGIVKSAQHFGLLGADMQQVSLLHLLGFRTLNLGAAILVPLLLTSVLFLGPLAMSAFDWLHVARAWCNDHRDLDFSSLAALGLHDLWSEMTGTLGDIRMWRNLVVGEEGGRGGGDGEGRGGLFLTGASVQMTYTTIFGFYATFLFLRTGHVAAPVAAHILCNAMGLPDFGRLLQHPYRLVIAGGFIVGLVAFSRLLVPLTCSWGYF